MLLARPLPALKAGANRVASTTRVTRRQPSVAAPRAFFGQTAWRRGEDATQSADAGSAASTAAPAPDVGQRIVTIKLARGPVTVPAAWLRDNCPQSRSPSSGNKNFATAEIPEDIAVKSLSPTVDGGVKVEWVNDIPRFASQNHVSTFTGKQLETITKSTARTLTNELGLKYHGPMSALYWDVPTLKSRGVMRIKYADWIAGKSAFLHGVTELQLTGLLFIEGVPKQKQSVIDVGLQFGALQETFYGRTFDVVSKPRAENVAYTSEYLGLHSDMLYLTSPPNLQLLHCLENEAEGGESLFSDAGRAALELELFYPDHADVLREHRITYQYSANGFAYHHRRPVIQTFGEGKRSFGYAGVWWSPPFQGRFTAPIHEDAKATFDSWHRAARLFQDLVESPSSVYRHRLQPGECVIFDNRRILHGRTAFDPSTGPRHLHGTYVHQDDWLSTIRRVPTKMADAVSKNVVGPRRPKDLFDLLRVKYPNAPYPNLSRAKPNQERPAGLDG